MSHSSSNQLYRDLRKISQEYLGPATDRFLTAQLANHLQKTPADITQADIPALVNWLGISLATITNNTQAIKDYVDKVRKLDKRRRVKP